ncbi:MAG TPA: dynamin family protein [Pseudonocardiaceae bacterium]
MIATPWLDALDQTIGACATHDRPEVADQLRRQRAHLTDPKLRVLIIGAPNQGKSQLVNALVNAPVCAVGDDLTTGTTTTIQHADTPTAALVQAPIGDRGPEPAADARAITAGPTRRPVSVDEISQQVTRAAIADSITRPGVDTGPPLGTVITAEVGIPRKLLASGLVLVDTPAIGESDSASQPTASAALADALDTADVVLLASDATAELSDTELDVLTDVTKTCPNIIVALTKIDMSPWWRDIAERDRRKLADAGLRATLVPVSSTLRLHAAKTGDTALNTESGFPQLITILRQDATNKPDQLAPRAVAMLTTTALAGLITSLQAEVAANQSADSPRTAEALARVDAAGRRMEDLRHQAALCQTTLSDDIGDLMSDIEYDLRDRTRSILREIDRVLDSSDPLHCWDRIAEWLTEQLNEAAETNFGWLLDRADWIVRRVTHGLPAIAGHQSVSAQEIIGTLEDLLPPLDEIARPNMEPFNLGQKAFTMLRGSYGGVLMFGLVTSLAGMPLINGISLSAGVAFGSKSIRDEADMRLKRRQAVAKQTGQRTVDDFFLAFSKEIRDGVRDLQRGLRDQITELSRMLLQRAAEDLTGARDAARAVGIELERHDRRMRADLAQLVTLHRRIETLAARTAAAVSASAQPNGQPAVGAGSAAGAATNGTANGTASHAAKPATPGLELRA